mgnify:CR=1 FL=1
MIQPVTVAEKMGKVTKAVDVSKTSIKDVQKELGMKEGFDVGMEMSGVPSAFQSLLAGMNHGGNLGADVYHSGTVAAVREAALHVGAALSAQMDRIDRVAMTFFGDGTVNQGVFAEALNLAVIWNLPVIFLCENNGWASTTSHRYASSVPDLAVRAVPGAGGNPLTAPVDYLAAVGKGKIQAEKTLDTVGLNQAIQMFNVQEDRYPKDLNELVSKKYLRVLPEPPYGMQIVYDQKTGTAKVVKK